MGRCLVCFSCSNKLKTDNCPTSNQRNCQSNWETPNSVQRQQRAVSVLLTNSSACCVAHSAATVNASKRERAAWGVWQIQFIQWNYLFLLMWYYILFKFLFNFLWYYRTPTVQKTNAIYISVLTGRLTPSKCIIIYSEPSVNERLEQELCSLIELCIFYISIYIYLSNNMMYIVFTVSFLMSFSWPMCVYFVLYTNIPFLIERFYSTWYSKSSI